MPSDMKARVDATAESNPDRSVRVRSQVAGELWSPGGHRRPAHGILLDETLQRLAARVQIVVAAEGQYKKELIANS